MESLFNNVISNTIGTVLGGLLFLSLVYYLVRDRLFSLPNVNGRWVFEALTVRSAYGPYIGKRLRFVVLLAQEADRISGTGEKVLEISQNGWRPFVEGEQRNSSTLHQVTCRASTGTMVLVGTFDSTASDQSGVTTWSRTAVGDPSLIARSSFPERLFRKLLMAVSWPLYANDWRLIVPEIELEYSTYLRLQQTVDFYPLIRVLIAGEDRRFGRHIGIDVRGIVRAVWQLIKTGQLQGASTIEQQLIRTLTRVYRKTLSRKLKEIILALRLSALIPKRDVPGIYICRAYYGWRMNGLSQSAKRLGVDLTKLDYSHAAQIIARIKCPEPEHPAPNVAARIQQRVRHLLVVTDRYNAQLKVDT